MRVRIAYFIGPAPSQTPFSQPLIGLSQPPLSPISYIYRVSLARKSCRIKKEPPKMTILLRNLYWRGGSKKSSILTIFAKKLHIFCYLLTKSGQKWPPRGVVTGLISPIFSSYLGPLFGDFCSKSSRNPGTRSRISRAKMTIF